MLSTVYNSGLRLDPNLTMAIKAIIQATETAAIIAPHIDIADAAVVEAREALMAQLTPDGIRATAETKALQVGKELVRRAPTLEAAAWSWLDQFGRGKLVVEVDTTDLGNQFEKLNSIGRRLTTGMIVVGQLIGTAIFAVVTLQPQMAASLGFVPGLAVTAFVASLVYSFYILLRSEAGGGGSGRSD